MKKIYKTIPRMKYKKEELWFPLSEDLLNWDEDFHQLMLNDSMRMISYERSIKEIVKPGMTVCDLGTGTGILALWALEAGAKKVYGIDVNKNRITQALERITQAGFSHKFQIHNDLSFNVNLPEKVDVVVSEILGNLGDNEDMTPILADARQRFLKTNGIMLPAQVKTHLVPISSEKAHSQVKNKICKGINSQYKLDDLLQKLRIENPFNLYYDCIIPDSTHLSNPQVVQEFNFDGRDKSEYQVKIIYGIKREGIFTGFKGNFSAELSDKVTLDISGDNIQGRKTSDCWKHCFLPIENPVNVKIGDKIILFYSRFYPAKKDSPFRQGYSWKGQIIRDEKEIGKFEQKMC